MPNFFRYKKHLKNKQYEILLNRIHQRALSRRLRCSVPLCCAPPLNSLHSTASTKSQWAMVEVEPATGCWLCCTAKLPPQISLSCRMARQ